MPTFHYQALNNAQSLVTGELTADSVAQAVAELQASGLTVQSIGLVASVASSAAKETAPGIVTKLPDSQAEQAALRAHMTRVLEQGKLIAPALAAYAEEMPVGRRRRQLQTVIDVLERGDATQAADDLALLPDYWIPLLSAASSSRDPGRLLREFIDESRRSDELRHQWWLTLAYPIFIALMAIAVGTALSFLVVPIFSSIFRGFDLELPALTRIVVALACWIATGGLLMAALICAAIGLVIWVGWRSLPAAIRSSLADRINWPFGRTTAIARFARFTADLLEGGLSLPDALRIAAHATRKSALRATARQLVNETSAGAAQRQEPRPLTAALLYAVRADIATPARVHLLREISNCHAARARFRLSWTRGFIEPLSICVVGVLVGVIVIAMFLPLLKLIEGLSK
jgi:type II secretory pathway component PulF